MIKKTIEIDVETGKAVQNVDKLEEAIERLAKAQEDANAEQKKQAEETKKALEQQKKAAEDARKPLNKLKNSVKALGGALKAAGIGLIVAAFISLKDALGQNEKAAQFFKVAFEAVSIVTQDFINLIINNTGAVIDFFKAIFENPQKSLKEFAQAFKENIQERFDSYLDTLGLLASAIKKVFSGDFAGALEDVKSAGKESIDVLTGVNNSFDKGVDIIDNVTESVTEYGKEVLKSAKNNIDLARAAEIAAAKSALLKEEFEIQAEKLRQIRDNDLLSIDERIKANDQLSEVLKKQQEEQLKEADAIIAAAQAQFNKNKSTENEIALLQAQAERKAVLNNITTQESEQLTNRNALIKEGNDLVQSGIDADTQRALQKEQFEASLLETEEQRLQKQRENLEAEREIEQERLQLKIDSFAAGTQARLDAENELKDRLQEIDQQITTNDIEQNKEKEKSAKALEDSKIQLATAGLAILGSLAKEGSALAKGVAVAQATINTFQGVTKALAETTDPTPTQSLRFANAAAVGIAGALNIAKILSTNESGTSSPTPVGAESAPTPPAFNLVGGSNVNEIGDTLNQEQQPVQAFVVGSEVTNQQELDNAQASSASLS